MPRGGYVFGVDGWFFLLFGGGGRGAGATGLKRGGGLESAGSRPGG